MAIQTFHQAVVARKNAGGGSACNTLHETDASGGFVDDRQVGGGNNFFCAVKLIADSTSDRCRAELTLKKAGSPTGGFRVQVWSHNGGTDLPDTALGTPSSEVDPSTIAGSYALVDFTDIAVSLTNGTTYWLALYKSSGSSDNSNYLDWETGLVDAAGGNKIAIKDAFGGGWVNGDIGDINIGRFNLYGTS